jgi:hypothetical protein
MKKFRGMKVYALYGVLRRSTPYILAYSELAHKLMYCIDLRSVLNLSSADTETCYSKDRKCSPSVIGNFA